MVDLEALEKSLTFRALDEGECEGLIAEVRALRAERDKWMADHAKQYSIAAAYAVERDALRVRVANLMEQVKSWHTRSLELERLGNAMAHAYEWDAMEQGTTNPRVEAWRKAVRG